MMRRLLALLLVLMLIFTLTACGGGDDEDISGNEDMNYEEDYGDEGGDEEDSARLANDPDDPYKGAWFTEPFHIVYDEKSVWAETEDGYRRVEVIYDGTDVVIFEGDNTIYYITEKDDVVKTFWIDLDEDYKDGYWVMVSDKEEYEDLDFVIQNSIAGVSNKIFYTKEFFYNVDGNEYEQKKSESKEGYKCDVYVVTFPLLEESTYWIDQKTGVLVWHESKPLYEYDEDDMDYINSAYGDMYKLVSFETKNVPKVSSRFDFNDYGGDPDDIEAKREADSRALLPEVTFGEIKNDYYSGSMLCIDLENATKDDVTAYVEKLSGAGFTVDSNTTDYDNYYSFKAYTEDNYQVSVSWASDGYVMIYLYHPDYFG